MNQRDPGLIRRLDWKSLITFRAAVIFRAFVADSARHFDSEYAATVAAGLSETALQIYDRCFTFAQCILLAIVIDTLSLTL